MAVSWTALSGIIYDQFFSQLYVQHQFIDNSIIGIFENEIAAQCDHNRFSVWHSLLPLTMTSHRVSLQKHTGHVRSMHLPKCLYNIQYHNMSPSSFDDWCGTLTTCPQLPTVKGAEDFHLYCLKLISPKNEPN